MRIGIYGGTFAPPHIGHVSAAQAFMTQMKLDILYVIPAGIPPHKEIAADDDPKHRLRMCELAFAGVEGVIVSDCELRRQGKSYTVDTLRELHEQYPDDELWFFMGTDMFLTFHKWYRPEEIARYAGLCAFGRSESDSEELFAVQRDYLQKTFPGIRIATMTLPGLVEVSSPFR